jgi:hypothetical protein
MTPSWLLENAAETGFFLLLIFEQERDHTSISADSNLKGETHTCSK